MKVTLNGKEYEVKFNLYTAKLMYEISGINILNPDCLREIFSLEPENIKPADYEKAAKFIFSAAAAGVLPDDADEGWRPEFTWISILSKLDARDSSPFKEIMAAYTGMELSELVEAGKDEISKSEGEKKM